MRETDAAAIMNHEWKNKNNADFVYLLILLWLLLSLLALIHLVGSSWAWSLSFIPL